MGRNCPSPISSAVCGRFMPIILGSLAKWPMRIMAMPWEEIMKFPVTFSIPV